MEAARESATVDDMELPLITVTLRLLLGFLWLTASAGKLRNPQQFAADVREYRLLPPGAAELLGRVLPPVELLLGISLLLGIASRVAAVASAALLLLFALAMGTAVLRKLRIRCHCFGELGRSPVSWPAVLRNVALAAAAVVVAVEAQPVWSLERFWSPAAQPEPALLSVFPFWLTALGLLLATHAATTTYSVFRVARGRRPDDLLRL